MCMYMVYDAWLFACDRCLLVCMYVCKKMMTLIMTNHSRHIPHLPTYLSTYLPTYLQPLLTQAEAGGAAAVDKDMRFSFLAGIVNEEDRARFERMLFRATKGR